MQLSDPQSERVTLTVQHLKRVLNDRPILQDINFAITTGEILFVRGPSGVGKSLLLRCLAHLDPIQARHASIPRPVPAPTCIASVACPTIRRGSCQPQTRQTSVEQLRRARQILPTVRFWLL